MLHFEDVLLFGELVHLEAALLGRQPRLSRLLLGDERRTRRRLGDSDAGEAGLLRWWGKRKSVLERDIGWRYYFTMFPSSIFGEMRLDREGLRIPRPLALTPSLLLSWFY